MNRTAILLSLLAITTPSFAQQADPLLPDPTKTPGAFDPKLDVEYLCHHKTRERRHVAPGLCNAILADYGLPASRRYEFECDHLVPLALGGQNTRANLWPQANLEAERKDRLETKLKRLVCKGTVSLEDARREITTNWLLAFSKRVKK